MYTPATAAASAKTASLRDDGRPTRKCSACSWLKFPHSHAIDQQKGEDILKVARDLVLSEGLQILTIERVAQEAGVSKVTLYARYTNRHELMHAVVIGDSTSTYRALGAEATSLAQLQPGLCSLARPWPTTSAASTITS